MFVTRGRELLESVGLEVYVNPNTNGIEIYRTKESFQLGDGNVANEGDILVKLGTYLKEDHKFVMVKFSSIRYSDTGWFAVVFSHYYIRYANGSRTFAEHDEGEGVGLGYMNEYRLATPEEVGYFNSLMNQKVG